MGNGGQGCGRLVAGIVGVICALGLLIQLAMLIGGQKVPVLKHKFLWYGMQPADWFYHIPASPVLMLHLGAELLVLAGCVVYFVRAARQ